MFAVTRQEKCYIVRKGDALHLRLTTEYGYFGFQIRRFDVGNQSPLETRVQPLLNLWYLARRAIGSQNDLLLCIIESIESVKKLLLRALLPGDELYVVYQQHIDRTISFPKQAGLVVPIPDSVDEFVHKSLERKISNLKIRSIGLDGVSSRLNQVGLAQ